MSDKLSYWKGQADKLARDMGKPCVVIKNCGSYQVFSKDSIGNYEYVYSTSDGASDSEVDNAD